MSIGFDPSGCTAHISVAPNLKLLYFIAFIIYSPRAHHLITKWILLKYLPELDETLAGVTECLGEELGSLSVALGRDHGRFLVLLRHLDQETGLLRVLLRHLQGEKFCRVLREQIILSWNSTFRPHRHSIMCKCMESPQ